MIPITVTVRIGEKSFANIEQAFGHVGDALPEALQAASRPVSKALRDTLIRVHKQLASKHSASWNGGVVNPSPYLQSRSGGGLRSIRESISVTGSGDLSMLVGRITTGKMTVHETGATIRAKRAKYLTIPLPTALDSRGVPLRKRARQWENTFVARSKRGNLLIFQKRGRNQITPLYLLKTEVTIKPRLGMEETIINDALPYFERRSLSIIEREIERVL